MIHICKTQAELDAAVKTFKADDIIELRGNGKFAARESSHVEARESSHVEAWGSSHVEARESSHVEACGSSYVEARGSSHVEACGSSHVAAWGSSHVEACGSSHVEACGSSHVEAWGLSHVAARESSHVEARGSSHVEAWGSSHVAAWGSSHVAAWGSSHVVAWGSSHVEARESSHVEASKFVAVYLQPSFIGTVKGGVQIKVPKLKTPQEWCEYYGVQVIAGIATLFKGVNDKFTTDKLTDYSPGAIPQAADWDGGEAECGGGLHFSPHPTMAKEFFASATKFIACAVKLKDMAVHPNGSYPHKCKAKGCCAPCVEVDIYGRHITRGESCAINHK